MPPVWPVESRIVDIDANVEMGQQRTDNASAWSDSDVTTAQLTGICTVLAYHPRGAYAEVHGAASAPSPTCSSNRIKSGIMG